MKKIFIDCGANIGQSAEAWINNIDNNKEYELHCFEASKKVFPTLSQRTINFVNDGNNMTSYNKAVWINNDGVRFHDMGNESSSTDIRKRGMVADKMKLVKSINLSEFIKNYSKDDMIVLKMDIEGGEYTIVPHLYETGALDYIDIGFFEFHATKMEKATIEADYEILRMLEESNVDSYYWSAEYTKTNESPYDENRVISKEAILKEWKRKRRI